MELLTRELADPTLAYLLLLLGGYGLLVELHHPGAVLPGVVGLVCLALAVVAFTSLPLSGVGLLLLALAVSLIGLNAAFTPHGALAGLGLAALVAGTLVLYAPAAPPVAWPALLLGAVSGAALALWLLPMAVRSARRPPLVGPDAERLSGATGRAVTELQPAGAVRVRGQLWSARLPSGALPAGSPVRVRSRHGLSLEVEPLEEGAAVEADHAG